MPGRHITVSNFQVHFLIHLVNKYLLSSNHVRHYAGHLMVHKTGMVPTLIHARFLVSTLTNLRQTSYSPGLNFLICQMITWDDFTILHLFQWDIHKISHLSFTSTSVWLDRYHWSLRSLLKSSISMILQPFPKEDKLEFRSFLYRGKHLTIFSLEFYKS